MVLCGRTLRRVLLMVTLVLVCGRANAASGLGGSGVDAAGLAWRARVGVAVPLDVVLRDEAGREVTLGGLLHGAPAILVPGWYHCPGLCGTTRDDLLVGLARAGLRSPADYVLISLSIDPNETPRDAAAARADDIARHPGMGDGRGWHFLTGPAASVSAITRAIGFSSAWSGASRQFLHPTGVAVLTPSGHLSGVLQGLGYAPADLRGALRQAALERAAPLLSPILLLCLHWDSTSGRWTLDILRTLRLAAALTVLTMGLLVWRGRRA